MNKDAIVATLIGFGVGLLVTGLVLYGPNLAKSFRFPSIQFPKIALSLPSFTKPKNTPTPTPGFTVTKHEGLTIESPLAEALEHEETLLVSGNAPTDTLIIITSDIDDIVVKANNDGKYAGKVTLSEGKNDITVTNIEKEKTTTQTVTVYYTPEEL